MHASDKIQKFNEDAIIKVIETSLRENNFKRIKYLINTIDIESFLNHKTLNLFGISSININELKKAKLYFYKSLKILPNNLNALIGLWNIFDREKNYEELVGITHKLLIKRPNNNDLYIKLGNIYYNIKKYNLALKYFKKTLNTEVELISLVKIAKIYFLKNNFNTSLKYLLKAHSKSNNDTEVCELLGRCYDRLGKGEKARFYFQLLAKIEPDKPHGFHNIGMSYTLQGDMDKAKFYYEMALNVDNNFPESNHNLSFIHLRNGNFKEGWEKYEYRLICDPNIKKPNTYLPEWNINYNNSDLFIWPEQGIGDYIFFSSMLEELLTYCKSITSAISPKLISLYNRSMPNINFLPANAKINPKAFSHQLAIGSIPKFLRKNKIDFLKSKKSYLIPDKKKINYFLQDKDKDNKLRVGLSWNSKSQNSLEKNIDLFELMNYLKEFDYEFINLQYGNVEKEIKLIENEYGVKITNFKTLDYYEDLDSLSALLKTCDIVITIPNATQTLSSALGIKTIILLNKHPSFRWQNFGSKCIWHPNNYLIRNKSNKWDRAFLELCEYLKS